jgi:type II secretory pathway pseudopilin PulG
MRQHRRGGFTLFQLLVVLAVIMILLGLLLPAIQKMREAAVRAQSQNNLKQIVLATINYADAKGGGMPAGVDDKKYSALFHILPYIEQESLYKAADRTKDMDDKANAKVRQTVVKSFLDPLDEAQPSMKWGATNYMGNAGTKASLEDNDGVLYKDSTVQFPADITDGTSQTMMFIETLKGDGGKKAVSVARQHVRLDKKELKGIEEDAGVKHFRANKHIAGDRGASWMDGRFLQATITATLKLNDERPDVDCAGEGGLSGARTLGSTVNVGLCDGSVRGVRTSISFATWSAVCTRAGGEVLGDDW